MKRERKPFKPWRGWAGVYEWPSAPGRTGLGFVPETTMATMFRDRVKASRYDSTAQVVRVEVRECLPPCRHPQHRRTSLSTETGEMLEICRDCGEHRATAYGNDNWRKPRRMA